MRSVPKAGPGEVVIESHGCGICAGDVHCHGGAALFWGDKNRPQWVQPGVITGHEFYGKVVDVGEGAKTVHGQVIKVGDLITSEQIVPCDDCPYCVELGRYDVCAEYDIYGFRKRAHGGMAEFVLLPNEARNFKVDPRIPPRGRVLIEPLSIGVHAADRAKVKPGDVVVVAGCGPIGLFVMIALKNMHKQKTLIALDVVPWKLQAALKCGVDYAWNIKDFKNTAELRQKIVDLDDSGRGYGCDVYIEATGHPSAVQQGIDIVSNCGTYVSVGVFSGEASIDWTQFGGGKNEITINGAHLSGRNGYDRAMALLASGKVPIDTIITHEYTLDEWETAFEVAHGHITRGGPPIKVVIRPKKEHVFRQAKL